MKEKILSDIYKKLSDGFDTVFFTLGQFEEEYEKYYLPLTTDIVNLFEKYKKFKQSKNKEESTQVIKIYRDDFIVDCYNEEHKYTIKHEDYSISDIKNLKKNKEYYYQKYVDDYDYKFDKNNSEIIISFNDFVKEVKKEFFIKNDINSTLSFEKKFWNYFNIHLYLSNDKEFKVLIDKVFDGFKKQYLEQDILKIYEIAVNQLNDIEISAVESYIVNIGNRNFHSGNSGWIINNFEVFNNKKTYRFSNSTKDESRLSGKFINVYFLQINKKHLLKISITINETEQIPFIIWKDFEKISLKNDCEIYISKHHSNESIVFDSKKEAINFQEKVLEIKERKNISFLKH